MKEKIFILLSCIILNGCFYYNGDIKDIKYNSTGSGVFILQSIFYNRIVEPLESSKLYFMDLKKYDKEIIAKEDILQFNIWCSPIENKVLFENERYNLSNTLKLYDYDKKKYILKKDFECPYPMNIGWSKNGKYFYYTDMEGINIYLNNGVIYEVVEGHNIYCLCWSLNGEKLIYTTDNDMQKNNSLYIYDLKTKNREKVFEVDKGIIYNADFVQQNSNLIILCQNKNNYQIYKINLKTRQIKSILSRQNGISNIRIIDDKYILFSEYKNYKTTFYVIDEENNLRKLNIENKFVHWDYNEKLKRLITLESDSSKPQEYDLNNIM